MPNSEYTKIVTRKTTPGSYETLYINGKDSTIVAPGGLPAITNKYKKIYGGPIYVTADKPIQVISQQEFNDYAEKFKPEYDNFYKAKNGTIIDKIKYTLSKLYK